MPLAVANDVRRVIAGAVEEILPGQRRIIVPFRGRVGIGVYSEYGQSHALRNLCPHKLGPLCVGCGSSHHCAETPPSSYRGGAEIVCDGEIIRCPWEFDISTGQRLLDPKMRVKAYPDAIADGMVVYADPADLPTPSPAHDPTLQARGLR